MRFRMEMPDFMRRAYGGGVLAGIEAPEPVRNGNRRRLRVFMLTFLSALALGEVWNLTRAPEYQASARIQVMPGGNAALLRMTPGPGGALAEVVSPGNGEQGAALLLDEAQRLSSRPLLDKVRQRLEGSGQTPKWGDGDVTGALQRMIGISPLPGSGMILLTATGPAPGSLALILNTLVEVYREELKSLHAGRSGRELLQARNEVARLEALVMAKREELRVFRQRHGVISSERDENETLARAKGLSVALNTANEKMAIAEARLRSLRTLEGRGQGEVSARDNPTLFAMEQRASQIREQLRDMERGYTGAFMNIDPHARAMRVRLSELERQIEEARASGRQAVLMEAEQDFETTRATVARLRQQLASERSSAQAFLARFSQAREMENDLTQLEVVRRTALERLAKLDASEQGLHPELGIVEMAAVPRSPWQPAYLRDGLLVLPVAFFLGALAMGFIEFFNRAEPASSSTAFFLPRSFPAGGQGLPGGQAPVLPGGSPAPGLPALVLPRELAQAEVSALLAACSREGCIVVTALLLGLSPEEILCLRGRDGDPEQGFLHVSGIEARTLRIPDGFRELLIREAGEGDALLLHDALGRSLTLMDLAALVSAAAHDAGLEAAGDATPEVLRHTCIAWLVRQGVRYSDLGSRVGRLTPLQLEAYGKLAPEIPRGAAGMDVAFMPALVGGPAA